MEEEVTRRYPCKIEGRFLRPCTSLNRIIEDAPSRGRTKGFFLDTYMNLNTGDLTMSFVRIKLGAFLKKGVVANFCPFCGTNIRNHIEEDKDDGKHDS